MSIRVGIYGYGNLGRGVECAIKKNPDMELVAVFTRRNKESVEILTKTAKVCHVDEVESMVDEIDVMILCGGSATDLPVQTPKLSKLFNVIDSFDTHAKIPQHFANVDASAKEAKKVAIISVGWDPGMFSLNRLYANAILVDGKETEYYKLFDNFIGLDLDEGLHNIEIIYEVKGLKLGFIISLISLSLFAIYSYRLKKVIKWK